MKIIERFQTHIQAANNIVISTHIVPDADGIGSQIALAMALRQLGKKAICVNEEALLDRYRYLDADGVVISYDEYQVAYKDYHRDEKANTKIDLLIVVDTNSVDRIGSNMKMLSLEAKKILYIDHHPCAEEVIEHNCIDTSKAATGELAGDLILSLNVTLNRDMALPLYTAILIDTSSFRYPTVTGNTHRLVGTLMDTGVRPPHAFNMINGTKKRCYMQLLGDVLTGVQTTSDEKVAWISLSNNLLDRHQVDSEDTLPFINHLLILDNIKVALMFREINDHEVKVSLRSIGVVDVGIMARALGGGGHDHSAAAIINGPLQKVIEMTVKKVHEMLLKIDRHI